MPRWMRTSRRSPPVSAGPCCSVPVEANQEVEAGAVLVEIDTRDYEVALERARAELADARGRSGGGAGGRSDHIDDGVEQRADGTRWCGAGGGRATSRPSRASKWRGRGSRRRRRGNVRLRPMRRRRAGTSSG